VLLVLALVSIVLALVVGIVRRAHEATVAGDDMVRIARTGRSAVERISADLRAVVYLGPAARYGFGLEGQAGDHPQGNTGGDRLILVIASADASKGELDDGDDTVQRGRADLRLVIYELQTVEDNDSQGRPRTRSRLVRMEQSVLDAVGAGEVTAEVLADDVEHFHLQYYGQIPPDNTGVSDASVTQGVGEYRWEHEWKSGIRPPPDLNPADQEDTVKKLAEAPEHPLPTAVQIVLVLKDPRDPSPDADEEFPRARWFETVVRIPAAAELVPPSQSQTGGVVKP